MSRYNVHIYMVLLGTIHLRRRQMFAIFDPYPPPVGNHWHSSKMSPPHFQKRPHHLANFATTFFDPSPNFLTHQAPLCAFNGHQGCRMK